MPLCRRSTTRSEPRTHGSGNNSVSPGLPPDPRASTADARVRRSGQLTLATNRSGDLDSPSSDPQWDNGLADIYYSGSAIVTSTPSADLLYLGSKEADYDTCRNTTGYSDEQIGAEDGA